MVALSKALAYARSLAGIAGSNPAGGMGVLPLVCVVHCQRRLRRADPSSRGVLPSVYVSMCVLRWYNPPLVVEGVGFKDPHIY